VTRQVSSRHVPDPWDDEGSLVRVHSYGTTALGGDPVKFERVLRQVFDTEEPSRVVLSTKALSRAVLTPPSPANGEVASS